MAITLLWCVDWLGTATVYVEQTTGCPCGALVVWNPEVGFSRRASLTFSELVGVGIWYFGSVCLLFLN